MLFHYKRYLTVASILLSLVAKADSGSFNSGGFFTWMGPVATNADLPPAGNTPGTAIAVLSPFNLYGWDGSSWQCLSCGGGGGGAVTSVFGRTGAVVANSGDYNSSQVTESGNLYFTNARAIAATLTGYASSPGTITAADSLLSAIQKLDGNVALKAPLASPALTGNPTAPTQAANNNSTRLATTAYADNAASAAATAAIVQTITNGDTTHASSSDALFDALALKQNLLVNSAGLAAALSDETGTGVSVFNASPTFTGTATFNATHMPQTVSPAVSIFMNDTDTGEGSDGDGVIYWSANGVERLRLTAASFSSTLPISAPNFVYPSQAQGLFLASPQSGAGVPVFRAIGTAEISSNQIAFPFVIPNGASETDPQLKSDSDTGLAFPSDGLFNSINNNVVTMRWAPGLVESVVDFLTPNLTVTATTTTNDLIVNNDATVTGDLNANTVTTTALQVNGNATVTGDLTVNTVNGAAYPPTPAPITGVANTFAAFDTGGLLSSAPHLGWTDTGTSIDLLYGNLNPAITNDFRVIATDTGGTVGGDYYGSRNNSGTDITGGYYGSDLNTFGHVGSATMIRANSSSIIDQDFSVLNSNTTGAVGGNYQTTNNSNSGNIALNYFGDVRSNSGTIGGDFHSRASSNSGHITGNYQGQGDTNSGDVDGNFGMLDLTSQSGHTLAGDAQFFHISSDSTILGNETLMNVHSSAVTTGNKTGLGLQLQGSAANVTGIYVDLNGVTSPNQKAGLTINNGSLSASYNTDTADFTPTFFGQTHTLGGNLRISSGFPIIATPLFGNNLGQGLTFDDDMTADNLLGPGNSLGWSVNGFINQMIGASGKQIDTVNFMLAAGSNPSGDGHAVNINMFRTAGFVNAGGAMTADNMRGFYVDPAFDGSIPTTNKWGFINASSSNNWMKGSLVLGGTTGLPTGAFALDITGDSNIAGNSTQTGDSTITGLLTVTGNVEFDSNVKFANLIQDSGSITVLDVPNRVLKSQNGGDAISFDQTNRALKNLGGGNNLIFGKTGVNGIEIPQDIFDSSDTISLSTENRELNGAWSLDSDLDATSHKIVNVVDPTNPQDVATKAYVLSVSGNVRVTNMISANFTVPTLTSDYILNASTVAGTFTVTLPDAAPSNGWCIDVKNTGTNTLSVDLQGGQTIDGNTSDSIDDQWSTKHYCAAGGEWYNY